MKAVSKQGLMVCLCCMVHWVAAQEAINTSAVLNRPLTLEGLAYRFVPQVFAYDKALPIDAKSVASWYRVQGNNGGLQREKLPLDGMQVLSVFVLKNPGKDTCRLIFPLPSLKTRLRFGMLLREGAKPVHFYHEINSWKVQSHHTLVYRPEEGKILLVIPPGRQDTVLTISNVAKKHDYVLYSARGYQQLTAMPAIRYMMFYVAMLSFLGFSILLSFIQYVQQRDVAFLYYVLYLSLMWLLLFRRLEKVNPFLDLGLYLEGSSWWWQHLRAPVYILSFVAYQIFIYYLLRDKVRWPWLQQFILWSNLILVALIPVHYVIKFYWERLDFMQTVLAPLAIFWLWNFFKLYQRKLGLMVSWVLLGSFFAAVGTILGNYVGTRVGQESPLTFLHIGDMPLHFAVVIDILCLAVALSFRHHAILHERNEAQNLALKTAKENATHAKKLSLAKKHELDLRKHELHQQSDGLIQQRITGIETQKQQALAETELLALREQLKPHFVANCINSIRNLIARDKTADASLYLSKLGILLGQIFEMTEKSAISLQEELELLKLYLDLEQLRFRDRFKVVFHIDPEVSLDQLQLPPMLLQPYAENAIKHAFKDNHPTQELSISVEKQASGGVILAIEDNGIGRPAAALKAKEGISAGTGVGMGLCADRLKLFNERFNVQSKIDIIDLVERGEPRGTRVEILFSLHNQRMNPLSAGGSFAGQ